jgi:trimethylamine--corrinoid protein Co-methyltransferase
MVDIESGVRRPATLSDVASCATMVDAIENLDMVFSPVSAQDVPAGVGVVLEYATTVHNCSKHVHLVDLSSAYEAEYIIRIAAEVAGGLDNLSRRPIISDMICSVSPLSIDASAFATALTFVQKGLPISSTSVPLTGGTSPITSAGALALANAEAIGIITILEAFHPGTPIVYSTMPSVMDPRTGKYRAAAPEAIWMRIAGVQVADRYGIPFMVGGVNSASKAPDIQGGYEKAITAVVSRLAGADIFAGFGGLDNATAFGMDQLVIDSEICEHIAQALEDRPIDDENLALDVIAKIGPEGHFMAEKHTLKHVNEIWIPHLSPVGGISGADHDLFLKNARKRVREILDTHRAAALDPTMAERIEEITKEARMSYQQEKS